MRPHENALMGLAGKWAGLAETSGQNKGLYAIASAILISKVVDEVGMEIEPPACREESDLPPLTANDGTDL